MKTLIALLLTACALISCSNDAPTTRTETKAAPSVSSALKAPDENAAVGILKKISEAQSTYFKINRRYALTYDELIEAHLLSSEPSVGETGYDFKLRPAADAQTFKISVIPADVNASNIKRLFMDQTGVIRAETGRDATAESPALK